MSTPSSHSLTQSSSGSTTYLSISSHRSSLLNSVVDALRPRRKRRVAVDASIVDGSHHNTTYNYGEMNIAHGNNVVQNIQVGIDPIDALVLSMERSLHAEFDIIGKVKRESCTPQTRQNILRDLKIWCSQKAALLLYWLSGMPGTGKTTIVYTLCQYLREHRLLGASFFCSRSLSDCQDIQLIFPTIAFQLARNYPVFGRELANVLRKDPDIPRRALNQQLQQLIIEPFKAKEDDLPSDLVVVLDALDECNNGQTSFLQTLVKYTSQLPFRLILTSRPEYVVHDTFQTSGPSSSVEKFVLHEVEKGLVREDIIKYLQSKLSSISPRPDMSTINTLADYSGSAFILAATIVRLIMDEDGDPTERLEVILEALASRGISALTEPLDTLYTEIISRISKAHEKFVNEIQNIKDILFTVICVREPLTTQAIATLWGFKESVINRRLKLLRSVIFVPEDNSQPITIFHASFLDFITNRERSGEFYCDIAAFHGRLTAMCFRTMNQRLHQNICKLEGCLPNEAISQDIVVSHIEAGLVYACIHWSQHLGLSGAPIQDTVIAEESYKFISHHLFHWLECLSLIRFFHTCEKALDILERSVKNTDTIALVQEAREFFQLNHDIISYSANETYFSALVWVPTTSLLRVRYAELWKQSKLPGVLYGLSPDWTTASRAINIHTDGVKSLVITKDGSKVISGSDDATVRVWNAISQKENHVFTGHLGRIQCVAVSPDGTRVFSASSDKTVRVWDLGNPEPTAVFQGHSDFVQSVAVSGDGKLACSCDIRSTIVVWDAQTTEIVRSMKGAEPTSHSLSAIFMSNNLNIISVSYNIIQIWNIKTGVTLRTFNGHDSAIEAIAISSRDTHVITGSADKTAKVWNPSSGKKLRTLRGHTSTVHSVAFFHDGRRAVSGSGDKTVRVWSIKTGDTLVLLTGHSQIVWSVAVFPSDRRIASGSWDKSILLWAIPEISGKEKRRWTSWTKKAAPQKEEDEDFWKGQFMASSRTSLCLFHHKKVYILNSSTLARQSSIRVGKIFSAAFSNQETRLATAETTTTIWEISTGRKLLTLKGHEGGVTSASFSHDDKRIVTGSSDGTARVWCAITGMEQRILRHPNILHSVAFSPDDALIATSSNNKTSILLWDSKTGDDLSTPIFKTNFWAHSTVFSADGSLLIGSTTHTTLIWKVPSGELVHSLDGYKDWTSLRNSVSYTILDTQWVCKTTDPTVPPVKLCWIPPKYRPLKDAQPWKPVAFSSESGDRILLTSTSGAAVLSLPVS